MNLSEALTRLRELAPEPDDPDGLPLEDFDAGCRKLGIRTPCVVIGPYKTTCDGLSLRDALAKLQQEAHAA